MNIEEQDEQSARIKEEYHGRSLERLDVAVEQRDQRTEGGAGGPGTDRQLASHRKSDPSIMSNFVSMYEARKTRLEKEQNVQKLHNRIALLEKEEEKANRKIEDTRKRAYDMIQSKIEKDNFTKKINQIKDQNLARNQEQVMITREMEENVKYQKLIIDQRKKFQANIIKKEGKELKKLRN